MTINNIFEHVAKEVGMWQYNLKQMSGYEPQTTFYQDFTIAELCGGTKAIEDTYKRAFKEWKNNYIYITELSIVLNHKIWRYWQHNDNFARLYDKLWKTCAAYCEDNLKGEELSYYYQVTD